MPRINHAALQKEAQERWAHLLKIRDTVAPLHAELPPDLSTQLATWLDTLQAIEATAHFHHAVLAPDDSNMMITWVKGICSRALDDVMRAAPPSTTLH